MDPKECKLTLIGYSHEHKGYRFIDRENDSVVISRDARFIELGNGTSSVELPVSEDQSSSADQCLYVKGVGEDRVFLLVYVDDILLASKNNVDIKRIYDSLNNVFKLTCLGEILHFLGLEVKRENGVLPIRLKQYIDKLVAVNGMHDAKTAKSPMNSGYLNEVDNSELLKDNTKYRSLVGGLLYLSVIARSDIAASTVILGRRVAAPSEANWTAVKRVLRYLKLTREYYLRLGGASEEPLVGYSDADWAGDPESRRSTSGAVFFYAGGTISWASRRQSCVTLSSMEAEFVALSEACQETIWLRQLLPDFGEDQTQHTEIREDNQGCLTMLE
ncbi:uncharacterized protein LOC129720120 [Wyeomyia smithii]|uniref:uncharacterized protein LOC129720120 n=1 Tax=Wyeomyia smithii TaxID=174621 RepID=UPI002467B21D|nr:uncharacterized protein LOC129720120 [Wyeomyia smithii]